MAWPVPDVVAELLNADDSQAPRAFERFFGHYRRLVDAMVHRAALRHGRLAELEELTQEVWLRLMQDHFQLIRRYVPERGLFEPYFRLIVYHQTCQALLRGFHRVRSREVPLADDELADQHTSALAADFVQSDLFRKAVEQLEQDLSAQDIVLLREHYLSQRTMTSIAIELGVTENTLHKRHGRLKVKLRRLAEELGQTTAAADRAPRATRPRPEPLLGVVLAVLAALGVSELHGTCSDRSEPLDHFPTR